MAIETLKTRKTSEEKKEERRVRRRGPSASQIYLSLAQILFKTQEQTRQEQLAAIQFMMEYIQAVGFLDVVFSWDQRDELALMIGPGPEIGDIETISLLDKCIHILIGMVSTPKHRDKLSDASAKELLQSPEPASERGDFSKIIQTIVEGINASSPEVKDQFRQILKTLESLDSIFHNLVTFSKSPDSCAKHKFNNPDRHQRLASVSYHIYLMALMKLADSNPENQVFQEVYDRIISKLDPGFTLIIRRKLLKYSYSELSAPNTREILRCLVELIESKNLQKKPEPEPVTPLIKVVPKGKEGGEVANLEGIKKPDPRKIEWIINQTLTLEEVYEILYPQGNVIPKGITMFELAISALARYLPLPKGQRLSVDNLLDYLMEEFENPEFSHAIADAIKDEIKKGELKEEGIIKLIVEDEEGAKESKRLKELKELKELKRLEQLKFPIKSTPQRNKNNQAPTT